MVKEEPSIKVSYDTTMKSQPMPSKNCPDYFKNDYNESQLYPYSISYEPKGQISLNADTDVYTFEIYINDETFESLNQSDPMIMQAIDIETIEYSFINGNDFYAKVPIGLKTPILQIEKEQRARTITEVIANISALYGLTLSIYVLLFGARESKPLLAKYMILENPSEDDCKV
ncbi:10201_t:CDS:2 [Diversispora eburnea]|uniref:10201_t:CDS:1 n=1 Tax=Diversispora eburnea TaxID=1213867 RepID=A0A9N9BXJ6_9GLOM|nr:10201_t:CDS:2 [Diversispora eburnea]